MQTRLPNRTGLTPSSFTPAPSNLLQRACACGQHTPAGGDCSACASKRDSREQQSASQSALPPIVHQAVRSTGQPLDAATRTSMQPLFNHDFSHVRVHHDAQAAASARAINARAYTVGSDIFFGEGRYQTASREGRRLVAHELTHVMQQRGAGRPSPQSLRLGSANDQYEQQAHHLSQALLQREIAASGDGAPAPVIGMQQSDLHSVGSESVVQRDVEGALIGGGIGAVLGGIGGFLIGGPVGAAVGAGLGAAAGGLIGHAVSGSGSGTLPRVTIGNFRNTGATDAENQCVLCPLTLGPDSVTGVNTMELRGDVSGHRAGAQYDFKRTKERATWKKVGGVWSQLTHVGPGADDDSHDQDEDLTVQNNHIFVIDGPGFSSLADPVGDASATEAVYKASFTESANVRVGTGAWTKNSNDFDWHSVTWLEQVGGVWQRKPGSNEIASSSTTVGTGAP